MLDYIKENQIRAVFTFDSYGVSGHLNHQEVGKAIMKLKSNKQEKEIIQKSKESPEEVPEDIKLYTLESVNILRKYSGIVDLIWTLLKDYSWVSFNLIGAWKAMGVYESQFVWYRKFWVVFSRYTYMNTFQRMFISVNGQNCKEE